MSDVIFEWPRRRLKRDHIISETWSFNGEVKIYVGQLSRELDLYEVFTEYQSVVCDGVVWNTFVEQNSSSLMRVLPLKLNTRE